MKRSNDLIYEINRLLTLLPNNDKTKNGWIVIGSATNKYAIIFYSSRPKWSERYNAYVEYNNPYFRYLTYLTNDEYLTLNAKKKQDLIFEVFDGKIISLDKPKTFTVIFNPSSDSATTVLMNQKQMDKFIIDFVGAKAGTIKIVDCTDCLLMVDESYNILVKITYEISI